MRDTREQAVPFTVLTGFEAAVTSIERCMPFDCELIMVAANLSVISDAALSFDVLVNGAEITGNNTDLLIPDATTKGRFPLDGKVFLAEGDALSLLSNAEQTAASNIVFTAIVKQN